jgi:hypothetical protein
MTIIEEVHNKNRPMPEIFTRHDIRNTGGWDVGNVRAVRGEPYITVAGRIMRVPLDDSQLARAIRAHEQIHVKVSPQDLQPYITDVTGEGAVRAAEEARVNLIASMLGFPMKSLVTGSEKFDGELLADNGAWPEAVYAVAASVHTGSLNPLIVGIRRIAPVWADILRDIAKEIVTFQKKQIKEIKKSMHGANSTPDSSALQRYGNTDTNYNSETIIGMNFTIELAMLLESIASMPVPEQAQEEPEEAPADSGDDDSEEGEDSEELVEQKGETNVSSKEGGLQDDGKDKELKEKAEHIDRKDIQKKAKEIMDTGIARKGVGEWLPVRLKHVPLTLTVPGAIGRKRVASNVGRNPRRMHRMLTDPDRRIFDKYVKASGGVVLIDVSGSMSLSKEEVRAMMEAAPGCTVIAYSTGWDGDNTYILADKGKMCDKLPRFRGGNGNDLPAIQYAVSRRTSKKAPVIWVTDGMVYRPSCGGVYDETECAKYAQKNQVHMEYSPKGAIDFLQGLQRGQAYKPQVLERWKEHLKQS